MAINKDFFKALGIWALFTDGSALALFLMDGWPPIRTQWFALLAIFAVTVACALVLRLLLRFLRSVQAATLGGLALGAGVAILGGAALMAMTPSFESPALFAGGLMFSIPNGIGGALAGWMQGKAASPSPANLSAP